jgi:hypothetical protein
MLLCPNAHRLAVSNNVTPTLSVLLNQSFSFSQPEAGTCLELIRQDVERRTAQERFDATLAGALSALNDQVGRGTTRSRCGWAGLHEPLISGKQFIVCRAT